MAVDGIVRSWVDEEGWGVIDSLETPGGCWAHYSHLSMAGFRTLSAGDTVRLEWESPGFLQDGFAFRSVRVSPLGEGPAPADRPQDASAAYRSTLTSTFDEA